jgi:hypothetical protein
MRKFVVLILAAMLTLGFSGVAMADSHTTGKLTGSIGYTNINGDQSWADFSVHGSDHPQGVNGTFSAVVADQYAIVDVTCFVRDGNEVKVSGTIREDGTLWDSWQYAQATVVDGGSSGFGNDEVKFDVGHTDFHCAGVPNQMFPVTSGNLKVHD